MPSGESNTGTEGSPPDLRSPDGKPIRLAGLAVVTFETESEFHPSVDEEVDFISEFGDFRFIDGLPDPEVLKKWLLTDKVLVDCGEPLGLVPMQRYAEAGLFYCGVTTTLSHLGMSAPRVALGVYPRGVMWLKKNYVPTPERHRGDYVPEELRTSLD